ncbi:MAG: hypothetical protein ACRCU3_01905 [Eubacteriaceae bacterium]
MKVGVYSTYSYKDDKKNEEISGETGEVSINNDTYPKLSRMGNDAFIVYATFEDKGYYKCSVEVDYL